MIIVGPIARLFFSNDTPSAERVEFTVRVPQCKPCSREAPLRADGVDPANYTLSLVVHEGFAQALVELRP